ncbi:MAG: efflux RND transporter periplasmic adaptor subunit [Rhodospirillaceae bacterium]|jgi:membrane fusion protein, multidrug efflux system|nr:efflux RND transporter periplasmic adaptor subunit [Rhodospirillaceae bacterium]MBT5192019.1 efflux RND transporter periplasmic adaptor subunit [Rhodospirillaceae bacterium]MBT5896374.1 efflux RND transporter periplasmic adaptor subunit [Rhodospirillaceae bacterium]MBT6426038.1 efflux RND transporter periplasmic adaptor subunit [Rhodospirillaceae bacterium]
MSLRLQFLIVTLLAAILAAGWWSFDSWGGNDTGAKKARRTSTTLVLVEEVSLTEDRVTLRLVGTGKAVRSAALHPAVSGEVRDITFKAEQKVRKGQALIRLDDKHQRLKVRLAEVAVAESLRQLHRIEKLAPSGHAAKSRLDTARTAVEIAQLHLEQAKAELQDRTLFAPFAGVVGMTQLDRGDRVTQETMAVTLDDRSSIIVEFSVPENHAGGIKVGDRIAVRPWSISEQVVDGKVTAVASRIEKATRSLPVQAKIPNPKNRLRPGGSFEVKLAFIGRTYPIVREVAVLWSRDGAYLWRINDGKADKVFVKMVRRDKGRILVDGPLLPGDLIVVEGVQGLRLGQGVKTAPFKGVSKKDPA